MTADAFAGRPFGAITDVAGVRVGHHQRTGRGWRTGTTAVLAPDGATPGVDVRGGGPGTRETDALAPGNLVDTIHAVCLSGGSAYGLAAADGVAAHLEQRRLGVPVGPEPNEVVPVVPAAVVFDLGRGGRFANRPDASFGARAASRARSPQDEWGAVGAGTGARAGRLQGGVGTASTTVELPAPEGSPSAVTIGALAVVNSSGAVIDPATGLPWEHRGLGLRRPGAAERAELLRAMAPPEPALNTTIGVVATSADLSKAEVGRLASVAHDGLARSIRPAHGMVDGDVVFGLATGGVDIAASRAGLTDEQVRTVALGELLRAAAEVFATACVHAVLAARGTDDAPAYLDVCPSAIARR